jgi:hypothetical protein
VSEPLSPKSQDHPSRGALGDVGGYVALASTVILLLMPSSPPLSEGFGITSFVTLFGVGLAFGLGAVRRGSTGGRVTGGLALLVLSLVLSGFLIRGIVNWHQVSFYWGY